MDDEIYTDTLDALRRMLTDVDFIHRWKFLKAMKLLYRLPNS